MIHIYTGDGKGKTTASTGLVIRALGASLSSIIIRFIKKTESSEDVTLKELGIPVEYFGTGFIYKEIPEEAYEMIKKGLERTREIINNRLYDILVLDELNPAVSKGIISEDEILDILNLIKLTTSGVNMENAANVKFIGKTIACSNKFPPSYPPQGTVIKSEKPQN